MLFLEKKARPDPICRGGFAPNNDEAAQPLKMMTEKIQGGMIADFLTFNKAGELVALY